MGFAGQAAGSGRGQGCLVWVAVVLLAQCAVCGGATDGEPPPAWYNAEATAAFRKFLDAKLAVYERDGLGESPSQPLPPTPPDPEPTLPDTVPTSADRQPTRAGPEAVDAAMKLGACAEGCDEREARWNAHFQIINGTVYGVGGYGFFWNDHHRKRMKAVVTILCDLVRRQPGIPDVEFVVNMHDYNKLLRRPNDTLPWGLSSQARPTGGPAGLAGQDEASEMEANMGLGGNGGGFLEHVPQWEGPGYDWELHYRIYGNHFGHSLLEPQQAAKVALFSATSCAFSYDISFPTAFYDFERLDHELQEIYNKTQALFPWETKHEKALFRGSCWYYKQHGRSAAFTMSQVAPDIVDAAWYDQVKTDMLEKDGLAHFGDIWELGRHKYMLHLEGHDMWSMRIRYLSHINSLVLMQTLPCQEFYYSLFEPYEHYLPLRRDLADLYHQVLWAREHDDAAARISAAFVNRARSTLSQASVVQYVHMLLVRYSKLLRYTVRLHPAALALDPKSPCLSTLVPCSAGGQVGHV